MKAGWSSASWKWLKSGYLVSPRLSAANLTRVHVDLVGTCTRGDALDTKKSFSPPGCRGQHGWVSKTITLEDAVSHRHQSELTCQELSVVAIHPWLPVVSQAEGCKGLRLSFV